MTDKQINAAIAEACGWTDIRNSGVWHNFAPWGLPPQVKSSKETSSDYIPVPNFVPNYCTDLNAMHEAESVLTEHQNESIYPRNLGAWRNPTKPIYATARQRAEAFLRTLGKWEEAQ